MTFREVLTQVIDWLQQDKRVSYRALKREFDVDDDYIEDLKEELIEVRECAVDRDNKMLVWAGRTGEAPEPSSQTDQSEPQPVVEQAQPVKDISPPVEPHTPAAERRQLTVMFCDLVGSTSLSGQLDPEDLRDVIRDYQSTCTDVIKRYDGHVAQLLGDGLLVYFGYPQAHEDDAQRAIHSGLGIIKAIDDLNTNLEQDKGLKLAVRLGIHTGVVVVGEMGGEGRQEQLALGETPNVAARIQGLAEPDTVIISVATHRLIQGYFDCESLGEHDLRGVVEPMAVYRVLQESGAQGRLDIARSLTPLVGREQEFGLLFEHWEQAKEGQGQVVLLSGEAGIGKSRLVQSLKDHVAEGTHIRLECRSSPYYQNTTLYPIVDLLQRILDWQPDDTPDEKLEKLEQVLGQYRLPLNESVPLFSSLLSLILPADRHPSLNLTPQRQRQKTLEIIVSMLVELAERQPVLFIVEDLHWTDPSTLEFLGLLIERIPTSHLYALFTCRPEFEALFGTRSNLTQMTLNRLSQDDVEQIVHRITDGKPIPREVLQQIIDKTDGVPLFIEEMTKSVLESGFLKAREDRYEVVDTVSPLSIPSTLQDSLMARLDRLVTAKGVAQQAAVIGRQFSYELLQAISQLDAPTLQRELERLVNAELIYQRGLPPHTTYMFKHALIQDTAYESLLRSTRQHCHQRIAQTLKEQFPEATEAQPELLAHHYTEAGLHHKAMSYWRQAGEQALDSRANEEALGHFQRALAAKNEQPMDTETAGLLFGLGCAQGATGHAPDAWSSFRRAFDYYLEVGDTVQAVGVATYPLFYVPGVQHATYLAEQALRLAPPESVEAGRLLSRYGLLLNLETGDYHRAQEAFNQAIVIAQRERDEALEMQTRGSAADAAWYNLNWPAVLENSIGSIELARRADDLGVEIWSHFLTTVALFGVGDCEGMNFHAQAMLEMAESFHNRGLLANALWLNSILAYNNGEWQVSRDFNHRALELSPQFFMPLGYRAQLEYQVGDFEQGKAYMERLLDVMHQTPPSPTAEHTLPAYLIPLIGYITGASQQFEVAEAAATTVLTSPSATPMMSIFSRVGLALIAVQRGDVAAAEQQYTDLESQRDAILLIGMIVVGRLLGLLAQTIGNLDDAQAHFEDALAFCRKADYRPELAWSLRDYADMLIERDNEGDRVQAMTLLDEALSISTELGMKPLVEKVAPLLTP